MKTKIIFSLFITATVLLLIIGGVTTAWFTDEASPSSTASMVTGEMDFEITSIEPEPDDDGIGEWNKGECCEFKWNLENTGTKNIFLRARLVESFLMGESAWSGDKDFSSPRWAYYFEFDGINEETATLWAGQKEPKGTDVGTVTVSNSNDYLSIKINTKDGWEIKESSVIAVTDLDDVPTVGNNNPAHAQFPDRKTDKELTDEHFYKEIDIYKGEDNNYQEDPIYIMTHASVIGKADPSEAKDIVKWSHPDDKWTRGISEVLDGEEVNYWYLCQPIEPGETVVLELEGCLSDEVKSGIYNVELEAEAVQASHDAIDEKWPDHPCSN